MGRRGTYFSSTRFALTTVVALVGVVTAAQPQGSYMDQGPMVCEPDGSIDGMRKRDDGFYRYPAYSARDTVYVRRQAALEHSSSSQEA